MRPAPLFALLLLLAAPLAMAGLPACADARDPALLPLPGDVEARARAAGFDLNLVEPLGPAPSPPIGVEELLPGSEDSHVCTGKIRPGARLSIAGLGSCTLNWVLRDPAGALYVGTAGHCVPHLGFQTFGVPGVASDIGDAVYTTGNGGIGNDFAIIKVDPSYYSKVTPTMCHWGGPVKMGSPSDAIVLGDTLILHYGWGYLYGTTSVTRARAGELPSWGWGDDSITFLAAIAPGDSGSAFQTYNGGAAGLVTHGLLAPGPAPAGLALGFGTRLDDALARAGAAQGTTFTLVTSSVPVDLTGLSVP